MGPAPYLVFAGHGVHLARYLCDRAGIAVDAGDAELAAQVGDLTAMEVDVDLDGLATALVGRLVLQY